MGDAYIAAEPRCPTHGKMAESFERDRWVCHGYDGEGCDHVVRAGEITWTRISETEFRMSL